jgi:hypothetical protein
MTFAVLAATEEAATWVPLSASATVGVGTGVNVKVEPFFQRTVVPEALVLKGII